MTSITFDTQPFDSPTQPVEADRQTRFNQVVAIHLDDLYRYGYWLVGNRSIAEDLVQDTMLRAWRALDKLENPKAAKGWLITILRRENARRFERIRPQVSEQPTDTLPDKHRDYDTSTEAFVLRQAIEELPQITVTHCCCRCSTAIRRKRSRRNWESAPPGWVPACSAPVPSCAST